MRAEREVVESPVEMPGTDTALSKVARNFAYSSPAQATSRYASNAVSAVGSEWRQQATCSKQASKQAGKYKKYAHHDWLVDHSSLRFAAPALHRKGSFRTSRMDYQRTLGGHEHC